ncbi:acetylornithine deacetylase/succinyldiaminopimelate desuccinylase-like deacylase [Mollisia scopiformis]|uniref:Acetylornithine deacetylase/succinyldiaminopimelate desuccinylase-like deacylase n=1 Tax=Mollisia scopiformis TaxID=149040 RepID=A0A194XP10_MOLSC|nr:acetylornithine deacetylase/succinyldiaminopimelate desuccinylase-like deacylase [Mollisia scopiformis]KUJ21472.1 acetylornithine deacetylase/succinyldiaminopimelate desuccinylase-like deacylase [Mollisia scopiformis]
MDAQALLKIIEADEASHISFLQSFTQAPSPNPPGDTREAADVIINYLKSRAISPEIIAPQESMPNVCSDTPCGSTEGPRLIMNGHIDVFPAGDGADWDRSPWSGEVVDGRLHGRGTVDMKAGTAASVIAYSYIHKYREHLKGSVALCAVSDEETGGKWGTKYLLEDPRWRGDCVIDGEPGGLGTIRFAEKGTLRLTFTVKTEGAHGAHTHRSKSATRIAAALINELAIIEQIVPDLEPTLKEYMKRKDVRDAIDASMGAGAADITLVPTLNIGTIHGGLKVNVIPGDCIFEADIRMPMGLKADQVMEVIDGLLERFPETTVEIQKAASNPAAFCAHDHPMVDILARNAAKFTGKKPVTIPSLGATDCKFYRYKDIPAYVYGLSPETMAARNESVSVDEFLTVVKTHTLAAWEYLGGS